MAGSLGFRRQYCIPKGKASAGYRFADHLRSSGKALCRAERWKRGPSPPPPARILPYGLVGSFRAIVFRLWARMPFGESLLAGAGSGGGDWVARSGSFIAVIVLTTERATPRHSQGPAFARNRRFCDGRHSGRSRRKTRLTHRPGPLSESAAVVRCGGANAQLCAKDRAQ
jgi:hypothetical protein